MAAGRPTKVTDRIMEDICQRIGKGESLVKICNSPDMPSTVAFYAAINNNTEFLNRYARAREEQADFYADEIIAIADDKSQDILEVGEGGDIRSLTNSAAVQRAKLQVDARKWKASQLAPKRWGQQNSKFEHTGADGGPMTAIINITSTVKPNADD